MVGSLQIEQVFILLQPVNHVTNHYQSLRTDEFIPIRAFGIFTAF